MDYKHPYYRKTFLKNKYVKPVTSQHPIVAVVLKRSFLHFTIQQIFRLYSLPHHIKIVSNDDLDSSKRIMINRLPMVVYQDEILEQMQISEFLCDLTLGSNQYADFMARKTEVKRMMSVWLKIFAFESKIQNDDFAQMKDLGVNTSKDYQNLLMEEFMNLSAKFVKKGLEKSYEGYSQNDPNPQNIILVDIITSIMKYCPQSLPDFYLRAHFLQLIDFCNKIKQKIENKMPLQMMRNHEVVLQRSGSNDEPEWKKLTVNPGKFLIAFGVMGGLYAWFVKQ